MVYKFPHMPKSVVSRLTAAIGNERIVEAMIVEKGVDGGRYDEGAY